MTGKRCGAGLLAFELSQNARPGTITLLLFAHPSPFRTWIA